jgi:hypothetical protein
MRWDDAGRSGRSVADHRRLPSPAGLDWQPGTGALWIADGAQGGIACGGSDQRRQADAWRGPHAVAIARCIGAVGPDLRTRAIVPALAGNLFVASSAVNSYCVSVSIRWILARRVEAAAAGCRGTTRRRRGRADGAIYCNADSVWRIVPAG